MHGNLHPHHRIDFNNWCKRIESKLVTGERYFTTRVGLYDAMPAFWKHMSCEHRHEVVNWIDGFYHANTTTEGTTSPWTFDNVMCLLKYVALDDIEQLQGCYITSKLDPSVFVELDQKAVKAAAATEQTNRMLVFYAILSLGNHVCTWMQLMALLYVQQVERQQWLTLSTSPILWHVNME